MTKLKLFFSNYIFKVIFLVFLTSFLTGCVYWRLFQIKQQLNEFDQFFSVIIKDDFIWHFKQPLLYSEDFIYLSKFYPTTVQTRIQGDQWHYQFYKVDKQNKRTTPSISYYFELSFNNEQRLTEWSLSSLFLNIAPADFLEVSLRSIGKGNINKAQKQIKVDVESMQKTAAELPKKSKIIGQLGEPLNITREENLETYTYHFLLDTPSIKEGYEDRALTIANLSFDENDNLVKVKGRFVGIKLKIDYRKYMSKKEELAYKPGSV